MSKLDAAHIIFRAANGKPVDHMVMHPAGNGKGVVTLQTQPEGVGGKWTIESAPFIVTSDPKPAQHFVTVYDSTTVETIGRLSSSSEEAVAAYDDGLFDNLAEAKRLYPNHHVLSICVRFGDRADYADTEKGNMSVDQAVRSFQLKLVRGIYADRSTWDNQIVPILRRTGLKPFRWVADWTGHPHLPLLADGVRADACQWDNHTQGRVNTDVSLFESTAL